MDPLSTVWHDSKEERKECFSWDPKPKPFRAAGSEGKLKKRSNFFWNDKNKPSKST